MQSARCALDFRLALLDFTRVGLVRESSRPSGLGLEIDFNCAALISKGAAGAPTVFSENSKICLRTPPVGFDFHGRADAALRVSTRALMRLETCCALARD